MGPGALRAASERRSLGRELESKLGETLNDTALCEMAPRPLKEARDYWSAAIEHQRKALSLAPRSALIDSARGTISGTW